MDEKPKQKSVCEKPRKPLPKTKRNEIFWIKDEREPNRVYHQFGDVLKINNVNHII